MTSLVVRKVSSEGVVKLERIQIVCPACGQQVQAVATDGRVKGYCAVARQSVDFLVETQRGPDPEYRAKMSAGMKKRWQDPEYRTKMGAIRKKWWQDPEYRAKMNAGMKKRWQDPEYQAKMRAAHARRHNKRK
ncbi:unnamed protein product [marine sediment metagenome]|uniref:Uncharacterized protein n=1 Tax=marine sediment metagenome TaxID=412755 RepID=X1QUL8_9ZZZZ